MVMTKAEALKVLEIGQGSTPEEVRSSYKKLALKWHPDKHNNSAESTKKFQEISEAYKRLTSNDDDDDITISMADMFDLFAHIFFSNNRRYFVNGHLFYSDDDDDDDDDDDEEEYYMMNASESSDDDTPVYKSRQHHAKYSDLMASRVSRSAATAYRNEMRKKKNQVHTGLSEAEAMKNAEELIKEEEKLKKKAEKRRARKKRNRANRKQREKEQKADDQEAENDDTTEDASGHSRERRDSAKENENPTTEQYSRTNSKRNKKSTLEKSVEEDDSDNGNAHDETWDTSSAFFNHAARRGPVNTNNHTGTSNESTTATTSARSSVNRDDNNSTQATRGDQQKTKEPEVEPVIVQSRHLAACGNTEANQGNYAEAIDYFTQAISLHNRDFRFFGNRSYCYDRLGEYTKALQDAEITILLVPTWAKGYFRKGRALAGLKEYADAEKAFLQVLKLDKHCEDAKFELTRVRVQQLQDMGFGHAQSERAVRLYGTVHAALDALLSGKVKNLVANDDEMYVSDGEVDEQDNGPRPRLSEPLTSLWVGNIDPKQVTERQLTQLFSKFGTIKLIRILPPSFCAFVNYESKESAARAMQALQGYVLGGQNIRIRFQTNDKSPKVVDKTAKPSGPVNGNECYFWRTTGCAYGDKCHYTHVPSNKGIDIEKVEQKYGKIKTTRKGR